MSDKKPIIKVTTPNSNKYDTKVDIYTDDPRDDHETIHIAVDSDEKIAHIIDTTNGETEHADVKCYLTTACMKHYLNNFDDNCYELIVLRWFRDNFVSKEDIKLYYEKAPLIVEAIEAEEQKDIIYDYIYDNIVDACVRAIEHGDYNFAYNRYKSSLLSLEKHIYVPYYKKTVIKDWLFKPLPKINITDKTIEHIKNNLQMYVNAPVRIFMGKVYTDEEYEKRRKRVLETPLP